MEEFEIALFYELPHGGPAGPARALAPFRELDVAEPYCAGELEREQRMFPRAHGHRTPPAAGLALHARCGARSRCRDSTRPRRRRRAYPGSWPGVRPGPRRAGAVRRGRSRPRPYQPPSSAAHAAGPAARPAILCCARDYTVPASSTRSATTVGPQHHAEAEDGVERYVGTELVAAGRPQKRAYATEAVATRYLARG